MAKEGKSQKKLADCQECHADVQEDDMMDHWWGSFMFQMEA